MHYNEILHGIGATTISRQKNEIKIRRLMNIYKLDDLIKYELAGYLRHSAINTKVFEMLQC